MICPFGNHHAFAHIVDYWTDRRFRFETCCEAMYEECLAWMEDSPADPAIARWFELETGMSLKRLLPSEDGTWVADNGLVIVEVGQKEAQAFIARHHRHNQPPHGWRFGLGIANGFDLVGVAWVGTPVSRVLCARG